MNFPHFLSLPLRQASSTFPVRRSTEKNQPEDTWSVRMFFFLGAYVLSELALVFGKTINNQMVKRERSYQDSCSKSKEPNAKNLGRGREREEIIKGLVLLFKENICFSLVKY